ncbi:MAG: patatin-like phospholipase family protein [Candidatus Marinimicrobia bacterium]|nr:patatin-like phospholipase family protein [Candidatus Neomarinimicrobiota bacterium]
MASEKIKIGLVLGGGGARGLGHIGVLKALENHSIPIHMVAGTSIGSVIGAMYAATLDPHWVENKFKEFIDSEAYKRIGLHRLVPTSQPNSSIFQTAATYMKNQIIINLANDRLGIIKQERLSEIIDYLLPVKTFEELKIPFSCLAVDLNSGKDVVFNSGNLAEAIVASSAIPGYIPPIEKDGLLLTDGAVSCPVPVKTVRKMGADFRISVDVGLNHFEPLKNPNLLQVLGRAEQIASTRLGEVKSEKADITIRPDTMNVFWAEFDKIDQLIKLGAKETEKQFWEIKDNLKKKKSIHHKILRFLEFISGRERD